MNYIHQHAVVVQCSDPELLAELCHRTSLDAYLIKRLSPTVVIVDPEKAEELFQELVKKGYMPCKANQQ